MIKETNKDRKNERKTKWMKERQKEWKKDKNIERKTKRMKE